MKNYLRCLAMVIALMLVPIHQSRAQLDAIIGLIGKIKDAALLAKQLTELKKMTQNLMDVYEKTANAVQGFKAVKDVYKRGKDVSSSISNVADLMSRDEDNKIYSADFKTRVKENIDDALDELSLAQESVGIALQSAKLTMKERIDIVDKGMEHMDKALAIMSRVESATSGVYDNYEIASNRASYYTIIYQN
jgi:hypothetical protein